MVPFCLVCLGFLRLSELSDMFTNSVVRKIVVNQAKRANVGHIGSAMSVVDILTVLYRDILRIDKPEDPDRDRFIMSKGHAALALYAVLHLRGWITTEELDTYCADDTNLGVHPELGVKGVDFATGSLGHGISFAVGAALAARMQGSKRHIFALASDAECNEGIVWEAAMFAAHHELDNLTIIIDDNKQQAFGYTKDILDIQPLDARWRAFGWETRVIDGHDENALQTSLRTLSTVEKKPQAIIAQTVFGKGVSFMENKIAWHYLPLDDAQYAQAIAEIEAHSRAI
jgi:transketolase